MPFDGLACNIFIPYMNSKIPEKRVKEGTPADNVTNLNTLSFVFLETGLSIQFHLTNSKRLKAMSELNSLCPPTFAEEKIENEVEEESL
ncbi:hypothetical protein LOAG_00427 [Loa loa]|uniref:Uncharacterized protein n=1 Tax=Loa loa TaxID=7209 RepID=A0A1I7VS79_LOALO|nr:hypothetical protein LOAG_00427 [Loa loa]EFO28055.1 hypothetical protein LOAG_00427 [Loa loa]